MKQGKWLWEVEQDKTVEQIRTVDRQIKELERDKNKLWERFYLLDPSYLVKNNQETITKKSSPSNRNDGP